MESDEKKVIEDREKLSPASLTESSPAVRWLDNFWYHHKWGGIITLFLAVVLIVGIVQICSRESYDIQIGLAGAYTLTAQEKADLVSSLTKYCKDYNEDGEVVVYLHTNQVYSSEEYESERAYWEAESEQFYISSSYNSDQQSEVDEKLMSGVYSIAFFSPYMYERKRDASSERNYLVPLSELYGEDELPVGVTEDGFGIRLGDTDLYKYDPAMQMLPEDTILCLHAQLVSVEDDVYAHACEMFRALADYRIQE